MRRSRLGVVEPDQRLAFGDAIPVFDEDLTNDASLEVLDRLMEGLHLYRARCRRRALERRKGGPDAEPADEDDDHQGACGEHAADQRQRGGWDGIAPTIDADEIRPSTSCIVIG
jgi:hypothetical protein